MNRYRIITCIFLLALANPAMGAVSVLGGLTHEMTLNPGGKYEGKIQILNKGDCPAQVRVFQVDYSFYADGRTFYNAPGSNRRSNAPWIIVSPSRITIPPQETASIYYELNAPNDSTLRGTYWSVIMVEPLPEAAASDIKSQDGKVVLGLQTVIRYAVQIITNIGDTGSSAVRLADNKVIPDKGKRILQTDIENVGDRWLSPAVWAELYDKDGQFVGRFEAGRKRIFPNCSVRHFLDLSAVPKGTYTALFVVDNGDDRVFGATYEVSLSQ
jgi:hypothetical protein